MKAATYSLSAAILASAFALSCQDSASDLVRPDVPAQFKKGGNPGGGGGGGGGGTSEVSAGLSGALVTAADHPMTATDSRKKLEMYIVDQGARGSIDFDFQNAATRWGMGGDGGAGGCWTSGSATEAEFNALAQRFTGDADPAEFAMTYDKTAEGSLSSNHSVGIQPNSLIGLPAHGDPPPAATKGTDADLNETYTYTGGVVTIWGEGKPKDRPKIFCPNATDGNLGVGEDVVVVTVKP